MIQYSCGCKFKTQDREEAFTHVVQTGHSVTVHGLIRHEELWRAKQEEK